MRALTLSTTIFSDSRIRPNSLYNYNNHGYLVEESKSKVANPERSGWQASSSCIKAHICVHGNEVADKVAKEDTKSTTTQYEYKRRPKIYLHHAAAEEAKQKWQRKWTICNKAAATKQFLSVQERLGTKITLDTKIRAVLIGHGETRVHLHRFNLRDDASCICGYNDQTMHHLLFHCDKTSTQREVLIHQTS